jgi:hypothetical protein
MQSMHHSIHGSGQLFSSYDMTTVKNARSREKPQGANRQLVRLILQHCGNREDTGTARCASISEI